jgi:hypothetical protein
MVAVLALLIILANAVPVQTPDTMEIRASVSGYNLLEPSARCCPFELHVSPAGSVSVTVQFPGGPRATAFSLSSSELAKLGRAIAEAKFFSLPDHVGEMPIDGDEHHMFIRVGAESRQIVLFDWPEGWDGAKQGPLPVANGDNTRRAYSVWKLIRALVRDPRVNVR